MYRYAATRNRVHRVYVVGTRAFKVEQCNLDDAKYMMLVDEPPEDRAHCKYCWPLEPEQEEATEEQTEAKEAPVHQDPAQAPRSTAMWAVGRTLAALALAGTAMAGLLVGVLFSPDVNAMQPVPTFDDRGWLVYLQDYIDRQVGERILIHELEHHDHGGAPSTPSTPAPTSSPGATASPAPSPSATPAPTGPASTDGGSRTNSSTTTVRERVVILWPTYPPTPTAPPPPAPWPTSTPAATPSRAPTPAPTPVPTPTCFRPGVANGADPCGWPQH